MIDFDNKFINSLFEKEIEKSVIPFRTISGYEIEKQMANVRHILFEVTDSCNLKCAYCAYGDLYNNHDKRSSYNLPLESAISFLDFIISHFKSTYNDSINYNVIISFYGGEPLINITFIKELINFIEKLNVPNIRFTYSMTTNAILLNRYMDYLVDKKFYILISLDGNKYNNSYRINHSNKNSYDQVHSNTKQFRKKYPEFFNKNIRFSAVLHNRNSVSEILHFFKQEFGKIPTISELNNVGISEDKNKDFFDLYQNKQESLSKSIDLDTNREDLFFGSPETYFLTFFLYKYSGNVFRTYNDLLYKNEDNIKTPTGTCFPFSKKVFITVNGKILPCERIGHQFALGQLKSNSVELDFETIAVKYNEWYRKISRQCAQCYNTQTCMQCLFNIEDIERAPICKGFMGKERFIQYVIAQMTYLEKNPGLYKKIMEELIME